MSESRLGHFPSRQSGCHDALFVKGIEVGKGTQVGLILILILP